MNRIICIAIAALGAALFSPPAAAAPIVPCGVGMSSLLVDDGHWLSVAGTRITARGSLGFSSFTMRDGYQVETTPLHTPAAGTSADFTAGRHSTDVYTGYFHDVFPGRGNGDEDRWQFWVNRPGQLWLRSVTWGGSWQLLSSAVCYRGPGGQIVVTGSIDNLGFGTDFWTFVMNYGSLI